MGVDMNQITNKEAGSVDTGEIGYTTKRKWIDEWGKEQTTDVDPRTGKPMAPEFRSLIDKNTGKLSDKYNVADKFKDIGLDTAALDKIKVDAMRDAGTQSAWAKAASAELMNKRQYQMDDQASLNQAQTQGAFDQLASQGGINSGSRERIARGGIRGLMDARQGLNRDFNAQELGLATTDESNRIGQLGQVQNAELAKSNYLAGQQQSKLGFLQNDNANALNEISSGRTAAWKSFENKAAMYGADKTAQAQKKSGGK